MHFLPQVWFKFTPTNDHLIVQFQNLNDDASTKNNYILQMITDAFILQWSNNIVRDTNNFSAIETYSNI